MNIKMTKASVCDGKRVAIDQVVDASDKAARFLLMTGKAVVFEPAAAEESQADGADDQFSEVEKAPKKRGRKKSPVNRMVEGDEIENRDLSE
ncbi:MAG: hypothetical protein KDE45_06920 [Caldilineaceae bacterium]|nr:hypothetical protein [Caldilineaceae bacterium]